MKTSLAWWQQSRCQQLFPAGGTWGKQGWVSEGAALRMREDAWGRRAGWWDAEGGPLWMDERLTERQSSHL